MPRHSMSVLSAGRSTAAHGRERPVVNCAGQWAGVPPFQSELQSLPVVIRVLPLPSLVKAANVIPVGTFERNAWKYRFEFMETFVV